MQWWHEKDRKSTVGPWIRTSDKSYQSLEHTLVPVGGLSDISDYFDHRDGADPRYWVLAFFADRPSQLRILQLQ